MGNDETIESIANAGVAMAAGMAPMAAFFRSKPDSVALWTTVGNGVCQDIKGNGEELFIKREDCCINATFLQMIIRCALDRFQCIDTYSI